ncbi:MAG: hypothetical protein GY745_05030 [Actinomycetia bacterium]|nr:hypothetical protein [Actinomycetes bacterium]
MAGSDPLPRGVTPMEATGGQLPTGDGWAFEIKRDGMRVIAIIDPDTNPTTRLQSTNLLDVTISFPELADLSELVEHRPAVLDGEVVVDDEDGRSDFGLLQQRMHVQDPAKAARLAAIRPLFVPPVRHRASRRPRHHRPPVVGSSKSARVARRAQPLGRRTRPHPQ